jgi:hypothetical protein
MIRRHYVLRHTNSISENSLLTHFEFLKLKLCLIHSSVSYIGSTTPLGKDDLKILERLEAIITMEKVMKRIQYIVLGLLFMGGSIPQTVLSNNMMVVIEQSSGERVGLKVDINDRFLDVINQIQAYFEEDMLTMQHEEQEVETADLVPGISCCDPQWNLILSHAGLTARAKQWRNYDTAVTKKEKEDILYIMRTLASDSLISIGKKRSSLKSAGDRIDHIHPYRFLITIFTDEELKARIAAIRDRGGWIGDGFFDGITGSLKEEAAGGNLHQFTQDFAGKVKIDIDLISSPLQQGKWKEFVNILIDKIPREIDPKRYDM